MTQNIKINYITQQHSTNEIQNLNAGQTTYMKHSTTPTSRHHDAWLINKKNIIIDNHTDIFLHISISSYNN